MGASANWRTIMIIFFVPKTPKERDEEKEEKDSKGHSSDHYNVAFLFLFVFCFLQLVLSWRRGRRMLRRARELLGHLTGSPRLCVWGARWSDRDPPCLPNVATSSWFAPHPGWSAPRLLVQWSAASSAACVCKTHSLCLEQELACLLRCCLLQKSAAAFCQSSL